MHYDFDKKKRQDLVYKTMENVGLRDVEDLYNKYPHELSGGMQQRIVICMALIANPNVLIADEPTTALDAKVQAQIIDLFKDLGHIYKGAILFISHDLNLINRICKKVMIMYAGRLVEKGDTRDVIDKPLHPYTKALLKAVPNYKKRGEALYNIKGHVPDLKNRSNEGCPFADRCDHTMDICKRTYPAAYIKDGREVHCHLYGDQND
nr:ABC transporter ATP-binding protein [Anaerococcus sp. NML200537]